MVERRVLRNDVERMIREQLLESRRPPGARIGIDGLARELAVSPTPVREAMVSLEQSGLVEYTALKGYVVAPHLTPEQIRELVDARSVVEPAALSRAFGRWESLVGDLEAAQSAHEEILMRIRTTNEVDFALVREHFQADWGFHNTILRMSANRYLQSMADGLAHHTHRMRQTWEGGVTDIDAEQAVAEHRQILERVRERNHDGALQALRSHLDAVLTRSLADETRAETTAGTD